MNLKQSAKGRQEKGHGIYHQQGLKPNGMLFKTSGKISLKSSSLQDSCWLGFLYIFSHFQLEEKSKLWDNK